MSEEIKVIFPLLFLGSGIPLAIMVTHLLWKMVDEINQQLAPEEQISHFGWHYWKFTKVMKLHKTFYPESELRNRFRRWERIFWGQALILIGVWIFVSKVR